MEGMESRTRAQGPCNLHWAGLSLTFRGFLLAYSFQLPDICVTSHFVFLSYPLSTDSENVFPFPDSYISKSLYLFLQTQTSINQSGIPS